MKVKKNCRLIFTAFLDERYRHNTTKFKFDDYSLIAAHIMTTDDAAFIWINRRMFDCSCSLNVMNDPGFNSNIVGYSLNTSSCVFATAVNSQVWRVCANIAYYLLQSRLYFRGVAERSSKPVLGNKRSRAGILMQCTHRRQRNTSFWSIETVTAAAGKSTFCWL